MPKKLTKEDFILKAKIVHGDKYDYTKVIYSDSQKKVKILCKKHNKVFLQRASNHLRGIGCPDCGVENNSEARSSNIETFVLKAKEIHEDKYNYSKAVYKGYHVKVEIFCKKHNKSFFQTPASHLLGKGCSECGGSAKSTKEIFIIKAKTIHGDRYDYSKVNYASAIKKVEIICKKHNFSFFQTPHNHLCGKGCPECKKEIASKKLSSNIKDFIIKAKKVHGELYEYSEAEYKNNHTKIKIICKVHNKSFFQTPSGHLSGRGCPYCKESKGERKIIELLKYWGIQYFSEKRFDDCKYKKPLPFDFYLPKYNIFIEFQGEQHYRESKYWHKGGKTLELQKLRDKIKKEYAEKNGTLIEIRYNEDVEETLRERLLTLIKNEE